MLKIDNVVYRYKNTSRDVLKGLTATFESGRLTAIVGPSGCGKTTLLSILAGLDKPTSGRVLLDGADLAEIDPDKYRREGAAMIFQAFNLFPLLTGLENVCYPMENNGTPRKQAEERADGYLESVGIDNDKYRRYPANLSGGEQQRVAIARALATGAKVIFADEPTGNLDEENGKAVVDLLRDLAHNQGHCIVIVTHNLEIADASDVVFRLSDGAFKN